MQNSDYVQAFQQLANRKAMACEDFQGSLAGIDFKAFEDCDFNNSAGYSVSNGVAIISIRGLLVPDLEADLTEWGITGYPMISNYLSQANSDSSVNSIILDIDSKGGFVSGLSAVSSQIMESEKPVKSFCARAYSAAYWLAASSSEIHMQETGGLGSVGVFCEHTNFSQALDSAGVSVEIFRSGFWKGAFSSQRPLSDRERERLQEEVDFQAALFFEHVSNSRSISEETVASWEGDTFAGSEVLTENLADLINNDIEQVFTDANRMNSMDANTILTGKAKAGNDSVDVDALVAQAKADAIAEYKKQSGDEAAKASARTKKIFSSSAPDALKDVLSNEAFADVSDESMDALIAGIEANTFSAAMNKDGGAGVGENAKEFEELDPVAAAKAAASEDRKARLAAIQESGKGRL